MTAYRDRLNAGHYQPRVTDENDPQPADPAQPELTNAQLRERLEALDLPTTGTKAELLARLEAA